MPADDWCDDRGDQPPVKFGRRARQWFERKLRAQFKSPFDELRDEEQVALVVAYYLEHIDRYVTWVDAAEWHGRGFSNGHWSYLSKSVDADISNALLAKDQAVDAMRYPSIEEWLRAEASGLLLARGAEGGTGSLPEAMRRTMHNRTALRAVAGERERTCRCGASFIADRRNARRCDVCRQTTARGGRGGKKASPPPAVPGAEHPFFTKGRERALADMIDYHTERLAALATSLSARVE